MIENLVPQDAHDLEGLARSHRVDQHVGMSADEVLGVENAIFVLERGVCQAVDRQLQQADLGRLPPWPSAYLTRGVDYLGRKVSALMGDCATEGVLNGGIVAFDKVPVDELDRERRFACQAYHQPPPRPRSKHRSIPTNRSAAHNGQLPGYLLRRHPGRFARGVVILGARLSAPKS